MRVLVTGGAGFIGRHSVRRLLREGVQVLVLDDFSTSTPAVLDEFVGDPGFDFVTGDVCDESFVRRVLTGWCPDSVVHLAGLVSVARSVAHPEESWNLNVQGTRIVAEVAKTAGCRRFVFASSAAVYADSTDLPLHEDAILRPALAPYGQHKAESELHLRSLSSPVMKPVLLRYFNVYGKGQSPGSPYSGVITRFVHNALQGLPLRVFDDGEQSRDFIHVDDVARANMFAAMGDLPPSTYNICSGSGTTINQLVAILRDWMPDLAVEHAAAREGEIRHSVGSNARLRATLPGGWDPLALSRGMRDLLPPLANLE